MKAMLCSVYRDANTGDCTNGGVSSRYDTALLIHEDGWRYPREDDPRLLRLAKRTIGGTEYIHAEPVTPAPKGCVGPMFGGNFIYTCDSRFPSPYPIPVHDRYETYVEYEHLSR